MEEGGENEGIGGFEHRDLPGTDLVDESLQNREVGGDPDQPHHDFRREQLADQPGIVFRMKFDGTVATEVDENEGGAGGEGGPGQDRSGAGLRLFRHVEGKVGLGRMNAEGDEEAELGFDLVLLMGVFGQGNGIGKKRGGSGGLQRKADPARGIGQPGEKGQSAVKSALGGDDDIEILEARGMEKNIEPAVQAPGQEDDLIDGGTRPGNGRAGLIAGDGEASAGKFFTQGVKERKGVKHIAHFMAADDEKAGRVVDCIGAAKEQERSGEAAEEKVLHTRVGGFLNNSGGRCEEETRRDGLRNVAGCE